ncbi:MAG: peptidase MA family metallohydrolase [Phycisphaeraceae bacterium]
MRRCSFVIIPVLLVWPALVWPGGASAQREDVLRFEPTPTLTVFRTEHYRIFTNLSKAETIPFGRHMDALFEQYERRFRGLGDQPIERMPLYLFETEQQYDRFLQEHDIDASHSGGMFFVTHRLHGLATWTDARSRRKTFEVLQHEGFHQFAWHAIGPSLPVWLNEGLAQYFEQAVLDEDGRMTLGLTSRPRIERVRLALQQNDALPIDTLTRVTAAQWAGVLRRSPECANLLYAQSWSLAYFLIHGEDGKHQPALIDYLKQLSRGERADDAYFMAFGSDGLQSLAEQWRAFALTQRADDVAEASERLAFLGTGLRLLFEQDETMPKDLDALRATLQRFGFTLRRSEMGVTRRFSADQSAMYRYSRDRGERPFQMLAPSRSDLPPRITAPGLDPEPTLTWSRDSEGNLVQDIAYD